MSELPRWGQLARRVFWTFFLTNAIFAFLIVVWDLDFLDREAWLVVRWIIVTVFALGGAAWFMAVRLRDRANTAT